MNKMKISTSKYLYYVKGGGGLVFNFDPLYLYFSGSESGSHNMEQSATATNSLNADKLPDLSDWHRHFTTIYQLLKSLEVEVLMNTYTTFISYSY